jgi:hypothetical protein
MPTMDKKVILQGTPLVWVHEITGASEDAITALWKFDNAQSVEATLKLASSATSDTEQIDLGRADGATIKYDKNTLAISGTDETDVTPAASSTDATGLGVVKFTLNEADYDSTTWTEFVAELKSKMNNKFFITIGTGQSLYSMNNTSYKKPDGFIHMIGKINADVTLSWAGNTPTTIALEFVSYKATALVDADITALYDGSTLNGIVWKLGGTTITIYPPVITAGNATSLHTSGDIVVVQNITTWA